MQQDDEWWLLPGFRVTKRVTELVTNFWNFARSSFSLKLVLCFRTKPREKIKNFLAGLSVTKRVTEFHIQSHYS